MKIVFFLIGTVMRCFVSVRLFFTSVGSAVVINFYAILVVGLRTLSVFLSLESMYDSIGKEAEACREHFNPCVLLPAISIKDVFIFLLQ